VAAPKATIRDFLGTLDYLMARCGIAQRSGDKAELLSDVLYVRGELSRAKAALERVELFEVAERSLAQTEKLVAHDQIHDADRLVLSLAIVISELTGQNDTLRRHANQTPRKSEMQ